MALAVRSDRPSRLCHYPITSLATPLVYDSSRCFFVLNGQESEVAISNDVSFVDDTAGRRIKTRCAVGMPAPNKSIRKLTIGGTGGGTQATSTSTSASKSS